MEHGVQTIQIRAVGAEVLFAVPDHQFVVGGVSHQVPFLLRVPADVARQIGEALLQKAEQAERFQGAHQVSLVGHLGVMQLPPYPEQADQQTQYLEDKRQRLLQANEQALQAQWRIGRRKRQV